MVLASELDAKRLSILLEAVPDRRRVAVLIAAWNGAIEAELRKAAAGLGVELLVFAVATPGDCPAAFAAMRARGAQALVISANPQFQQDVKRLAGLALEARLPTACEWADMAHAGCLIGYGPNRTVLRKRMATKLRRYFAASRPVIFRLSGRLHLNLA